MAARSTEERVTNPSLREFLLYFLYLGIEDRSMDTFPIDVANRDYHYLSQFEIADGKRNDADVPIHADCFPDRSLHFPSPTRIETPA